MLGMAMSKSHAYLQLRRIDAAKDIAKTLGRSNNKVYLDAETLLLNLTHRLDENLESPQTAADGAKWNALS